MRRCLPALLFIVCAAAFAQPAPAPQTEPQAAPDPAIQRIVTEDDNVRIEELRVRGQTQRIVVQPKSANVRPYEIVPADADPARASAGQRVWQVLDF